MYDRNVQLSFHTSTDPLGLGVTAHVRISFWKSPRHQSAAPSPEAPTTNYQAEDCLPPTTFGTHSLVVSQLPQQPLIPGAPQQPSATLLEIPQEIPAMPSTILALSANLST